MRFAKAAKLAGIPPDQAATVLDVGAREGGLKRFLPPAVRYQGVDITPEFASADVMTCDIAQGLPFADAAFDYVFCIEVLEHVLTPFQTLAEIHRVLRAEGILILSVPNPYHVKEVMWNVLRIPDRQGHLYSWTRQTMIRLGELSGFRLDAFTGTYLQPPIPMVALLARSIIYRFTKPAL